MPSDVLSCSPLRQQGPFPRSALGGARRRQRHCHVGVGAGGGGGSDAVRGEPGEPRAGGDPLRTLPAGGGGAVGAGGAAASGWGAGRVVQRRLAPRHCCLRPDSAQPWWEPAVPWSGVPCSPWKRRVWLDVRGKFFTQRAVRRWHNCPEKLWCLIPGGAQGQAGWGPGQPELVRGSPAHGRGWGGGALKFLPTQTKCSCMASCACDVHGSFCGFEGSVHCWVELRLCHPSVRKLQVLTE